MAFGEIDARQQRFGFLDLVREPRCNEREQRVLARRARLDELSQFDARFAHSHVGKGDALRIVQHPAQFARSFELLDGLRVLLHQDQNPAAQELVDRQCERRMLRRVPIDRFLIQGQSLRIVAHTA